MKPESQLTITGIVATVLGEINPIVGVISSIFSTTGNIEVVLESLLTGENNAPTNLGFEVNTSIIGGTGRPVSRISYFRSNGRGPCGK